MNDLLQAASEVQQFLLARNWRFCIIGGLAAVRWGEPRATHDVDISLLTGFGNEQLYVDTILRRFPARIADARQFALEKRVLLVSASNGIPIDIGFAGIPFEEQLIGRASPFTFAPEVSLTTCSAEDLVVLKAFAGRSQDWAAIEGILLSQGDRLDWGYIDQNLPALCELKDDVRTPARLAELRKQLDAG